MKKIIGLIILVFLISLASAEIESLGSKEQNECVELSQTCSNCTEVNITKIQYPNSLIELKNQVMTKNGYEYNYTFCNTSLLGTYIVTTCGDVDGEITCASYDFKITPTGNELTTQNSMIIGIILVILIVITILFFIFGVGSSNPLFKIGFLSGTILLIVFQIGYILKIIQTTIGEFTDLVSGFTPLYVIGIGFLGAWGIGIVLYLVVFSLKLFYKSRGYID